MRNSVTLEENVAFIIHLVVVQTEMWILEPGFVNCIMKCYPGHLSYFKVPWISLLPSDIQMNRKGCADRVVKEDYFVVCFLGGGGLRKGQKPKEYNPSIDARIPRYIEAS